MLDGLVPVGVLSHSGILHLRHLMDYVTIASRIHDWRCSEHCIKFFRECLVASKQVDEPLYILENGPEVVPRVTLHVWASPLDRIERFIPAAVLHPAAHESRFGVENVVVVIHSTGINPLVELVPRGIRKLPRAEIIIGELKGLCRRFIAFTVKRDISQGPVSLPSRASETVVVHGLMRICLQGLFRVEGPYPLGPGIGALGDSGNVEPGLSRRRPLGQPSEFVISRENCLHIFSLHRGMEYVGQRELRPEGIPETIVTKHLAVMDFAIIRAPVPWIAGGVVFVEYPREEV